MSRLWTPGGNDSPTERATTLPDWDFDAGVLTLGFEAANWAETWLRQPNGPRARQPFRLTRDQLTFLLWWYALDDDGRWLYRHGARRLAKGSGKSPFAAVWALIEFCAPVRLLDFDSKSPGGVRGRPVDMPLVQIAATAESQTANTMRMVRAFAPKGSPIVREFALDPGRVQYKKLAEEGTLEVITASATAAEGAESTAIVADETEHWKPSNGGPELMATLADNLAKSGARMIETSNAWVPGAEAVAQATFEDWVAQELGELVDDSARVLYDARIAPAYTDLADVESVRRALEHVYADCDWKRGPDGKIDVESILARIYRLSAKPDDSKRKYLNWPTAALDAWTTEQAWALLRADDYVRPVEAGDDVVLFFDGSKSRDASALIGCRVDDGHVFTVDVWTPSTGRPIDVAEVDRIVETTFELYNVLAFWSDVREWESFALTTWPQRYADRLLVMAAPSARPQQPVAWDMRGHAYEFAKATEAVLEEINDGAFTHDGDGRLALHVGNARRRAYRDAVAIGKEAKDSPRKIDAAVAMIGARMLRRVLLASKEYAAYLARRRPTGVPRRIR